MKILPSLIISQLFGCIIIMLLALIFLDFVKIYHHIEEIYYWIFYFILYFGGVWFLDKVSNIAFFAVLEQKYSFSVFLTKLFFIFDVSRNSKKLKIYLLLEKGVDVEKIAEFFEDKDAHIQYVALLLYADIISINPVLKWFEEKYTNKNLPIDKYFLPVYEYCLEKQDYA